MDATTQSSKVILVTGGNRGIGLSIVKSLAKHSDLSTATILMGCRNVEQGMSTISELQIQGIHGVEAVKLDVASDDSIREALALIDNKYGQLDVLVNNAGYATTTSSLDFSDVRQAFQQIYDVNVSSVALLTRLCLPLLRKSPHGGKVIQIGSARGSIGRLASGELPPTVAIGYSISKTALHALTLQMAFEPDNAGVEFQIASPGHCKTAFNGFRGARNPDEGAIVVVELVTGKRRETKIWETLGATAGLTQVLW